MNDQTKAKIRSVSKTLSLKAANAAAYPAVKAAYLAGEFRFACINGPTVLAKGQRLITKEETAILRTKGNPAIKMNDLVRLTRADFEHVAQHAPQYLTWCRAIDYSDSQWWSDVSRPVEAKRPSVYESWNSSRTLALMGERIEAEDAAQSEQDWAAAILEFCGGVPEDELETTDEIQVSGGSEMQDLIEEVLLDRPAIMQGEDYYTHTEYPVLESQASFMAHGSNEDLDDLFGEEPRDDRGVQAAQIERTRAWRASAQEEAFQESSVFRYSKCGHSLPSGIDPVNEMLGEETPAPKFDDSGKLKEGFFLGRSEFFAQRDHNHSALFTAEYGYKRPKAAAPAAMKWKAIGPKAKHWRAVK
jgi:rubrerythrin